MTRRDAARSRVRLSSHRVGVWTCVSVLPPRVTVSLGPLRGDLCEQGAAVADQTRIRPRACCPGGRNPTAAPSALRKHSGKLRIGQTRHIVRSQRRTPRPRRPDSRRAGPQPLKTTTTVACRDGAPGTTTGRQDGRLLRRLRPWCAVCANHGRTGRRRERGRSARARAGRDEAGKVGTVAEVMRPYAQRSLLAAPTTGPSTRACGPALSLTRRRVGALSHELPRRRQGEGRAAIRGAEEIDSSVGIGNELSEGEGRHGTCCGVCCEKLSLRGRA
ncbi:hypothetical protein ERJ75_001104900 [Trypanosoma vivax]|nr:hypothetical protein ERJ75_001104900 [Trypanosoma vivax]